MNRPGHEQVDFFVGTEVEHSPALGHPTLFVVGIQDSSRVMNLAQANKCSHIYFGANQSFPKLEVNAGNAWRPWERMVQDCLERGRSGRKCLG